ncbi:MAG: nucleotide sugar dehydrogenase [Patescibacteria group bacterium]|nr:nucleotide sugar dehydrogenase [Patescibacteria group bacterium]MDD4610452.1 nucleotide sugar dehydrogenase [Patescibacteria group bacterium]
MKILYIGGGYVGTCSAAVSADSGHEVLVYDNDKEKIERLSSLKKEAIESCLFEEGLSEFIIRNEKRLKFSNNYDDVKFFIDEAWAIFMCLPTPEKDESGETNLSYYESACEQLAQVLSGRNGGLQKNHILIVNKSTVPIEMVDRTSQILDKYGVKNYGVGSNPEFLVEGKAIEGSTRPQRVVVGAWEKEDFEIFRDIYKRFYDSPSTIYIEVNPLEAAAGKLLANYFLFNKVVNCFDVAGRTCENFSNLHYENVRKILISDKRIGDWGFYDSLYAGGSCYIKDARSLAHQLSAKGVNADMITNTLQANSRQLELFLNRPEKELNFNWQGKKIGLFGLAFKRDTNDIRNSAAIGVVKFLLEKNVDLINAYDPAAGEYFKKYFADHAKSEKIKIVIREDEAIAGADVLIIATDWPQFRELSENIKVNLKPGGLIMDGRRTLHGEYDELKKAGFSIIAVGSK